MISYTLFQFSILLNSGKEIGSELLGFFFYSQFCIDFTPN